MVFWGALQPQTVKCEEMKSCKILNLNVKVKTDENKC